MHSLLLFTTPPDECTYLPKQQWSLEYELVSELSGAEYLRRMINRWRHFGHMMFHPVCQGCRACTPIRVRAADFRPDRSQRRCRRDNEGVVELVIGEPSVTREKLRLYDDYHAFQAGHKGWPEKGARDPKGYAEAYVVQPFPVEEWCYYLGGKLVGVGYVDALAEALPGDEGQEGLSAIYFYYDPAERHRGLGTWNVLVAIEQAARRGLPYLYLGYHVAGCASLAYKARFPPAEMRGPDGAWR
jgi:arginyl-tRNA--protein-N-Asp/Glu arginylyltransferase